MSNKEHYVRDKPSRGGRSAAGGVRSTGGPRLFAQAVSTAIGSDAAGRGPVARSERSSIVDAGKAYDVSVPKPSTAEWISRPAPPPPFEQQPVPASDSRVVAKSLGAGKVLYTMMSQTPAEVPKAGKSAAPARKGRGKFGGDPFPDQREARPPPRDPVIKLVERPELDPDFDRDGVAFNVPAATPVSGAVKTSNRGGRGGRGGPSSREEGDATPHQSRKSHVEPGSEGGAPIVDVKGRGAVGKPLKSDRSSPTGPSAVAPPPTPPSELLLQPSGPSPWGELPPHVRVALAFGDTMMTYVVRL
jgi:hypothetical protein